MAASHVVDEIILELVSQDQLCVRTMHVNYTTEEQKVMQWSKSGYNFKCKLPSTVRHVEVTFSVVGGSRPCKVDRHKPNYPWVKNEADEFELEYFRYDKCPNHVQYHICGPAWGSYIWHVFEQQEDAETDSMSGFELASAVPDNMLPPEVLLQVPQPSDLKSGKTRAIFLNTPLEESEQRQIAAMLEELKRQNKVVPPSMRNKLLRLLQQARGDPRKAIVQMEKNMQARASFMPIREADLLSDLQKGVMYWHGRDFKCRPCLVIVAGRIDKDFIEHPEKLCKVAVFLLEFMVRHGMYPGRVENWGVIVDLEGAGQHGRPPLRLITDLVETLQGMFRFRMAWTKIVNAPWWFAGLWAGIKKVIPGESAKKVEILSSDYAESLLTLIAPSHLEKKYGGSADDCVAPGDFFPLRPKPGPFAVQAEPVRSGSAVLPCPTSSGMDLARLHELTTIESREGSLWINGQEDAWLHIAARSLLTPASASYLKTAFDVQAPCCENMSELVQNLTFQQQDSGKRWQSIYQEVGSDDVGKTPQAGSNASIASNKDQEFLSPSIARAALAQCTDNAATNTLARSPQAQLPVRDHPSIRSSQVSSASVAQVARPCEAVTNSHSVQKHSPAEKPSRRKKFGAMFVCCSQSAVQEPTKRIA